MPNSFCCYLNSSLKIQVILNGGIFTQTGPRSRSSSPAQLQLHLACFLSLFLLILSWNMRSLDFPISASRKGSLTLGCALSDNMMLSLSNKSMKAWLLRQRRKPGSGSFSRESDGQCSHIHNLCWQQSNLQRTGLTAFSATVPVPSLTIQPLSVWTRSVNRAAVQSWFVILWVYETWAVVYFLRQRQSQHGVLVHLFGALHPGGQKCKAT